ncbi:MAG: hypothetical protein AB8F74_02895 [Saprospiraceae bacterium]
MMNSDYALKTTNTAYQLNNKIMFQKIKLITTLFALAILTACNNNESTTTETAAVPTEITITAKVEEITFGKDGYTATLLTENGKAYDAILSIVNLGGPDNYQKMNVGDLATIQGINDIREGKNYLKVTKIMNVKSQPSGLTIKNNSFSGISPGDPIANYPEVLKKDKLKNGEGGFEIFRIINEGSNITAYTIPDTKNKILVGDIYIVSAGAKTEDGIEVGNTYSDLLAKYPSLEVHGSEIEGRTYAKHDGLSYRLDTPNFSYDVDKSKIAGSTKITEIIINK